TLDVGIGGPAPGTQFDQLRVSGAAVLDGTLNVGLLGGFTPESGDAFPVLTYGGLSGRFAQLNGLEFGDRGSFKTEYNPTNMSRVATEARILVSPTTGLTTTEDGGTDRFTVVLGRQPTADVSIGLRSSDPTQGTISTSSLTFTPANWNAPQAVTITG